MSIIFKQTSKNVIYTYIGVFFGAINTVCLYPMLLKDTYYGIITYMASSGYIFMPLILFGVHNSLLKFYPVYTDAVERNRFTTLILIVPLISAGIFFIGGLCFYEAIEKQVVKKNNPITYFPWMIFIMALSYALFEFSYAWNKVHLKSVLGNFLREVFHRIIITFFLILLYFDKIEPKQFPNIVLWIFVLRALLMLVSAMSVCYPKWEWGKVNNRFKIFKYNGLMMIMGFMAIVMTSIDKVIVGNLFSLEDLAFYGVATFIAAMIGVPSRSMQNITYPITARLLHEKQYKELANLYKKTSNNLYTVSSLIALLIVLNLKEFYLFLSEISENYNKGFYVVIIIAITRIIENVIGNNNSILFSSNYFRLILAILIVNIVMIFTLTYLFGYWWGILGVALAIVLTYFIYHGIKVYAVYYLFGMHPFSKKTLCISMVIIAFVMAFYFWDFPFAHWINIAVKSIIIGGLYLVCIYYLPMSKEIKMALINKVFSKFKLTKTH